MGKNEFKVNRRAFIQGGVLGTLASGITPNILADEPKEDKDETKKILNYNENMRYRKVKILGDEDVYLSVISLGGLVNVPPVNAHAIENGVNLCHISTSYHGGESIKKLGELMKDYRDKVYIALKDNFLPHKFTSVDDDLDKFKSVLETLNTDHVDFLMFNRHSEGEPLDPDIPERIEALKKAGVIRYAGLTTHGDVKTCCAEGVKAGVFSLIMPTLKQENLNLLNEEMKQAEEKGIGFMGMKTMGGLDEDGMQLAYLKKLLRAPAVVTVNKGIGSFDMFNSWRDAAKETLTSMEDSMLYRYASAHRSENCIMCDDCSKACPDNIKISTVIRCKDYYYGEQNDFRTAFDTYREIPINQRISERCWDCSLCEEACPNGIQIKPRLEAARQLFA